MGLNTVENETIVKQMLEFRSRIAKLEQILNGTPITTARIADGAVTDVKIDSTIFDGSGIISTVNFVTDDVTTLALNQTIPHSTETDITGANLSMVLTRAAIVLVTFSVASFSTTNAVDQLDLIVRYKSNLNAGSYTENRRITNGKIDPNIKTQSNQFIAEFPAGTTIHKLTGQIAGTGTADAKVYDMNISYVVLGT